MTLGACTVEVEATGSSGYHWIAYLVITLVGCEEVGKIQLISAEFFRLL